MMWLEFAELSGVQLDKTLWDRWMETDGIRQAGRGRSVRAS